MLLKNSKYKKTITGLFLLVFILQYFLNFEIDYDGSRHFHPVMPNDIGHGVKYVCFCSQKSIESCSSYFQKDEKVNCRLKVHYLLIKVKQVLTVLSFFFFLCLFRAKPFLIFIVKDLKRIFYYFSINHRAPPALLPIK